MESLQNASLASVVSNHMIVFNVSVDALHFRKQCHLPQNANISVFFQLDACKKMSTSYPCHSCKDRDGHIYLKENFQFQCSMAKNTLSGEYKAKNCKVVVLASYEMYGKRGYKPLARAFVPLHVLLPDLLSSRLPLSRTIEFDALVGFTIDTTWSAREVAEELVFASFVSCNNVTSTLMAEDEAGVNKTAVATESSVCEEETPITMPVDTPKIVKHQGTQTNDAGIDDIDEQIAAYLELAVENDELLRSLISVKMDHAMLANEVDALRKYNYTLEQRLLRFYRKSNEVL